MKGEIIPLSREEDLEKIYNDNDNFIIIYNTSYRIFTNPKKINTKDRNHTIAGFSINNISKNQLMDNETKIVIGVCTNYDNEKDHFYSIIYQIIAFNQLDGLMQTGKIKVNKIYYIDDGNKKNQINVESKDITGNDHRLIKTIFYYKLFIFANKYNFEFTFSENHDELISNAFGWENYCLRNPLIRQIDKNNYYISEYEKTYSTQTNHNYKPIFTADKISDNKCILDLKDKLTLPVSEKINKQWMNIVYSYILYHNNKKLTNVLNSSNRTSIFIYLLSSTDLIENFDKNKNNLGVIWTIYNFFKKQDIPELNELIIRGLEKNNDISFFYISEKVVRLTDPNNKIEAKFYYNNEFFESIDKNFDLDEENQFKNLTKANMIEIGLQETESKIYSILLRSIFSCDYACEKYNKMYGFYKIYYKIGRNKIFFELLVSYKIMHLVILLVVYFAYMDKRDNILSLIEKYKKNRFEIFELLLFDKDPDLHEFLINKLNFTIKDNKKFLFIEYIFSTLQQSTFINEELKKMDKLYFLLITEKTKVNIQGISYGTNINRIDDELIKYLFDLGDQKIYFDTHIVLLEVKYYLTWYSKNIREFMILKKDPKILLEYNYCSLKEDVFIILLRDKKKILFNILKHVFPGDEKLISEYNSLFQIIYIYI